MWFNSQVYAAYVAYAVCSMYLVYAVYVERFFGSDFFSKPHETALQLNEVYKVI